MSKKSPKFVMQQDKFMEFRKLTNQEILKKAIKKAIKGGWNSSIAHRFKLPKDDYSAWDYFDDDGWFRAGKYDEGDERLSVPEVIFNKEFAKALWGECSTWWPHSNGEMTNLLPQDGWQYHLQMMVIADDPIAYLGKNS